MELLQLIIITLIIFLAIPLGVILSKITKEELKEGRKAFRIIILISLITIVLSPFLKLNLDAKIFIIASMLFILILSSTSLKMSYLKTRKKKKRK